MMARIFKAAVRITLLPVTILAAMLRAIVRR